MRFKENHSVTDRWFGSMITLFRVVAFAFSTIAVVVADDSPLQAASENPRAYSAVQIRAPHQIAKFRVKNPDAKVSEAWLDDPSMADRSGGEFSPVGGYRLSNRVVVKVDDPAVIEKLLSENPELSAKPVVPTRGFWTLATSSVSAAAVLADQLATYNGIELAELDMRAPRSLRSVPDDPYLYQQWHLINDLDPLYDINIEPAWDLGYTGAGVVVGIVDEQWDHDHVDLAANYLAEATQTGGNMNDHATPCAGLVGAVAYNGVMGCGVAYGAQISGQRFGDDSEDAEAQLYRNDLNDIKSNSWGPTDDSQLDPLPAVMKAAFEEGVSTGRQGLGEIFVWAAGNGGSQNDRVDYDGYASSRYTIAVGAIGDWDQYCTYSERGCSLTVVAPSNGNDRSIATTTRYNGWTRYFSGTSASAPICAGVIALMLEANPDLTWRDVQHVLIESARVCSPDHASWFVNGAGYPVSERFGHGAVDAGAAVTLAETWQNVPHEVVSTTEASVDMDLPDNDPNGLSFSVDVTRNLRIESVELIPQVVTENIGDLAIVLTSPSGLNSNLARSRTDGRDNYFDFPFVSLRHWGENSVGTWTVKIADERVDYPAHWAGFRLNIYGTPACPGDLDDSGAVDLLDVQALLMGYGAAEADAAFVAAADFNNDKVIDLSDLAEMLSLYGIMCE